ncbi:ArsR family transcriptional regulator [Aurantimonas sp. A2-1-M11]|uniref:HVO_A0114 family putative DNA-binding protein n=1 Tax=Aurantimonas sp. A2-1-M11 TaxID=3113712 RepID=UPI002F94E953
MLSPTPEQILRALTPNNCRLLALISKYRPESVAALCGLADKSQSNVSRSLAALEEVGVISMVGSRTKKPELASEQVVIDLAALQGD